MKHTIIHISLLFFSAIILPFSSIAQSGIIKGKVSESTSNESIPFANVSIEGLPIGVASDIDGNYILENLEPGIYNITASFLGYKTQTIQEIQVTNSKPAVADFKLEDETSSLTEVVVRPKLSKSLQKARFPYKR